MSEAEGNNPECNEGDVVRLKSGGPAMTVESTGHGRALGVFGTPPGEFSRRDRSRRPR